MPQGQYYTIMANIQYMQSKANEILDNMYTNGENGIADPKPYIKKVSKKIYGAVPLNTLYDVEFYLFLLAGSEVVNPLPNGGKAEGTQYEGMKSDEIRNLVNRGYWTRTRHNTTSVHQAFACNTNGSLQNYNLTASFYLRYGFCI